MKRRRRADGYDHDGGRRVLFIRGDRSVACRAVVTCRECGAAEGHVEVPVDIVKDPSKAWRTASYRACSLGQSAVSLAEYERVVAERDMLREGEANIIAEANSCLENRLVAERERDAALLERDKWLDKANEYLPAVKDLETVRDHAERTRGVMIEALLERDAMLSNLTAVQARCTELLEEVRALRAARPEDWIEAIADYCGAW